jgi:hypothetical protein
MSTEPEQSTTSSPVPDLLAGYIPIETFATAVDRCDRTVRRWMDEPDGLPYLRLGNRVLIHVETARAWIFSRMKARNPRRRKSTMSPKPRGPAKARAKKVQREAAKAQANI